MARPGVFLISMIALAITTGCQTSTERGADATNQIRTMSDVEANAVQIEFLGFPDCPNTPQLRRALVDALSQFEGAWELSEIDQEQLVSDDPRRGYPAPTILINGTDLFGMPTPTQPSLGCRLYPGGLPGAKAILARIEEIRSQ